MEKEFRLLIITALVLVISKLYGDEKKAEGKVPRVVSEWLNRVEEFVDAE